MKTFRVNPMFLFEAARFETAADYHAIAEWAKRSAGEGSWKFTLECYGPRVVIETASGVFKVCQGDWVVRFAGWNFVAVPDEQFRMLFEERTAPTTLTGDGRFVLPQGGSATAPPRAEATQG